MEQLKSAIEPFSFFFLPFLFISIFIYFMIIYERFFFFFRNSPTGNQGRTHHLAVSKITRMVAASNTTQQHSCFTTFRFYT